MLTSVYAVVLEPVLNDVPVPSPRSAGVEVVFAIPALIIINTPRPRVIVQDKPVEDIHGTASCCCGIRAAPAIKNILAQCMGGLDVRLV